MTRSYYDDNFGHYEIESQDDIDFYFQNQQRSVMKKCAGCGRRKKLLPDYAYCDGCATRMERGEDFACDETQTANWALDHGNGLDKPDEDLTAEDFAADIED